MGYIPRAKDTEKPQTGKATEVTPVPMKEESLDRVPKKEDTAKSYGG